MTPSAGASLSFIARLREVRPPVDAELDEGAVVDQEREPLARGQLVLLVLARDLLLAAAELRLRAALLEVLDERSQRRALDERVRLDAFLHRPFHWGSLFSKNAVTPSMASSVDSSIVSWARR